MIQRKQLESILKINGVDPSSPDEEIRSVLLSARYDKNEVDTAIMVLRENTKNNSTRVDGLHKVFRSDQGLKPNEISSLLGIEVDVEEVSVRRLKEEKEVAWIQTCVILLVSLVLALLGVLLVMYIYKVGMFHSTASAFSFSLTN